MTDAMKARYEKENRCLKYLAEFVQKVKAEGLQLGENGYLSVGIYDSHLSISTANYNVPPEQQVNAFVCLEEGKWEVIHISKMEDENFSLVLA